MFKKITNLILMLIILVNFGALYGKSKVNKSETNKIKLEYDFDEKDIFNKENISISKYNGRVILLNFWATWCPPCRMEIPDFIEMVNEYSNKFIIIGISLDSAGVDVVKNFYINNKMNYPVIMGTASIVNKFGGISAIPTSFLIDKKGNIRKKIIGYRTKQQYLSEIIPLINEKNE